VYGYGGLGLYNIGNSVTFDDYLLGLVFGLGVVYVNLFGDMSL